MGNSDYADRNQKISEYILLIESYLDNHIDTAAFENQYLEMFKNDTTLWDGLEYETLNNLFLDIDAFCADESIRDMNDLDEPQLRARAVAALQKLKSL